MDGRDNAPADAPNRQVGLQMLRKLLDYPTKVMFWELTRNSFGPRGRKEI